jgi:hypothetical protein
MGCVVRLNASSIELRSRDSRAGAGLSGQDSHVAKCTQLFTTVNISPHVRPLARAPRGQPTSKGQDCIPRGETNRQTTLVALGRTPLAGKPQRFASEKYLKKIMDLARKRASELAHQGDASRLG